MPLLLSMLVCKYIRKLIPTIIICGTFHTIYSPLHAATDGSISAGLHTKLAVQQFEVRRPLPCKFVLALSSHKQLRMYGTLTRLASVAHNAAVACSLVTLAMSCVPVHLRATLCMQMNWHT
jgi:hypothetical protein